jgi:hypothetical protein
MARVMKTDLDFREHQKGIYPWDQWTDGQTWQCVEGVDFHIAPKMFASGLRVAAVRLGLQVTARVSGDTVTFRFRGKA